MRIHKCNVTLCVQQFLRINVLSCINIHFLLRKWTCKHRFIYLKEITKITPNIPQIFEKLNDIVHPHKTISNKIINPKFVKFKRNIPQRKLVTAPTLK